MKLESLPFDLCSAVAEANRIYFRGTSFPRDTESTPQGDQSSVLTDESRGRSTRDGACDDSPASVDPTDTDIRTLEFAHQIAAKNIRVTRSMEPKEQRNTEQPGSDASGFTPGPWLLSSTFLVCDSDARILAQCQPMLGIPELAPSVRQAEANARLIAAAPDLLAVVETLLYCRDQARIAPALIIDENSPLIDEARAAVAKAKGAA